MQWEAILNESSTPFSGYGQDTNWPLFSSTLAGIKAVQPHAAFSIVTGDLLAHHFREQFDHSAQVHDDAAYRAFVSKTIEFIALQLKQVSAGTPVLVTLGNNDEECGDYMLQPHGQFLSDTQGIIFDLAQAGDEGSFGKSWLATGSYNVKHPTLRHNRVLVINTVLFSTKYQDRCDNSAEDPGKDLLAWLGAALADAKKHHEKVWMIYHIPPGIDGWASANRGAPVLFWKAAYAQEFGNLVAKYSDVITASFAGHIHVDDFRLIGNTFVMIAPAVSPNIKTNPAFRLVELAPDGRLTDQSTYYLNNLAAAGGAVKADWELEYSFDQVWGLQGLDVADYGKLYRQIEESSETRDQWTRFFSTSQLKDGPITAANFRAYYCASGNTSAAAYQSCLSASK